MTIGLLTIFLCKSPSKLQLSTITKIIGFTGLVELTPSIVKIKIGDKETMLKTTTVLEEGTDKKNPMMLPVKGQIRFLSMNLRINSVHGDT